MVPAAPDTLELEVEPSPKGDGNHPAPDVRGEWEFVPRRPRATRPGARLLIFSSTKTLHGRRKKGTRAKCRRKSRPFGEIIPPRVARFLDAIGFSN